MIHIDMWWPVSLHVVYFTSVCLAVNISIGYARQGLLLRFGVAVLALRSVIGVAELALRWMRETSFATPRSVIGVAVLALQIKKGMDNPSPFCFL